MLMQAPEGRRLIEPAPGRLLPNDAASVYEPPRPLRADCTVERGVVVRLAPRLRYRCPDVDFCVFA
jgi:hypothetical protein